MCVIIYKPYGQTVDVDTLYSAFENNPDGIGIAWRDNNKVHGRKGIEFESVCAWASRDVELLIHFRLATHGAKSDLMCHPFPVSPNDKHHALDTFNTSGDVLMHNGIIHSYGDAEESDTLQFTRDCLAYLRTHQERVKLLKSLESKFALISPEKITLIGGFEEYQGSQYSNLYFLRRVPLMLSEQFEQESMRDVPLAYWEDEDLESFYGGYEDYAYCSEYQNGSNRNTNRKIRKLRNRKRSSNVEG